MSSKVGWTHAHAHAHAHTHTQTQTRTHTILHHDHFRLYCFLCRWGRRGFVDNFCGALASVPRSTRCSHLTQLNLASNKLGHSGVYLLCTSLENSQNKLEILRLHRCGITNQGCAALALALKSNTSHLRELGLSHNVLGDSGVSQLCAGLENTNCILEILSLRECCITDESCAALGSALKFNPSHLTELDLSGNRIAMPGKNLLDELKDSPDYKLDRVIMLGQRMSRRIVSRSLTNPCFVSPSIIPPWAPSSIHWDCLSG
ncbi:ribonuclease inhibitor-like [Triplophysa rosa]|uniref:ribonuclease inhibitor-like n=1 Tax=Triplophysa rosa TaxID=992332 RepID=UPI002545E65E|nr:ribonuclease inhibitor-like [Triplophysa rosa]